MRYQSDAFAQPFSDTTRDEIDGLIRVIAYEERLAGAVAGAQACVFVVAAARGKPEDVNAAVKSFDDLASELFVARSDIINTLKGVEIGAILKIYDPVVGAASKRLDGILIESGIQKKETRDMMTQSFETTSKLLAAAPKRTQGWWCKIYGLSFLCS